MNVNEFLQMEAGERICWAHEGTFYRGTILGRVETAMFEGQEIGWDDGGETSVIDSTWIEKMEREQ